MGIEIEIEMEIIFLQKWKVRMVYCDNKGSMIFRVNGNRNRNGNGNYFFTETESRNGILLDMELE